MIMSNIVTVDVTETTTYSVEIDLDKYGQDVTNAYKDRNASYFSDWKDDAEVVNTDYDWG
ncbi:MAG: hypothetical protein COA43_14685 [Robiginitomaculum sp.]|nr:MAG: hypothetical protein COA43_14685 [Robiginitomaculum sp.]